MPIKAQKPSKEAKKPGSREISKQERKHRILTVARRMFAEHGYDRSTMRRIAAEAGVTAGTLFKYVSDKRDLIHLIFNEDMRPLTQTALASPRTYQSFDEKLLNITEHYYRHFASDPLLSRVLLSEILVETPGLHLEENLEIRSRLLHGIEKLVVEAKTSRAIEAEEDASWIALQIFFVYASALRHWLASSAKPQWREGHRAYERCLRLQLVGLGRRPGQS